MTRTGGASADPRTGERSAGERSANERPVPVLESRALQRACAGACALLLGYLLPWPLALPAGALLIAFFVWLGRAT